MAALAGMAARVARPLVSLATLPFLLSYLGQDQLGIWLITLSLFTIFGFASSGLSAGIVTAIGQAAGKEDPDETGAIILGGYAVALSWAALVNVFTVPLALLLEWDVLLGGAVPADTMSRLFVISGALIGAGLVSILPRFAMLGRGHGGIAFTIETLGVLLGGASLITAIHWKAGLPALLLAFFVPAIIIDTIGGMAYFALAKLRLISARAHALRRMRVLYRDGTRMLGYHAAYGISSNSDTLVIGLILGPSASAVYGIAHRIFSVLIMLGYAVNTAQWPAFAKACGSGNFDYVRRVFRKTVAVVTAVATVSALALAVFYEPILELWIDQGISTPASLLVVFVAWTVTATFVNCCDSVLKAKADFRFMLNCALSMSVINLVLTVIFLPLIGVTGAVLGTLTAYVLAMLIPFTYRLRRFFISEPVHCTR